MKKKALLLFCLIVTTAGVSSCAVNIFSYLNPTVIDVQTDPNILIGMGEYYITRQDYTNAYYAYTRAVQLSPFNSRALDGTCTAYIYMHFTFNSLFTAIMSSNYAPLGPNNIYIVGNVVSRNLGKIVSGVGDGVIASNDVNTCLNYFIFNSFYSIFYIADSDDDGSIASDTNDYLIVDDNLVISNRFMDVITDSVANNNIIPYVAMAYNFNYKKRTVFTNLQYLSYNSLACVNNALVNDSTKATVAMISNTFAGYASDMSDFFDFFSTNDLLVYTGESDFGAVATNYFPGTYLAFVSQTAVQGISPPSEITNAFPDMTNMYEPLTNKYLRNGLD